MDKTKLYILLLVFVALFFLAEMEADASASHESTQLLVDTLAGATKDIEFYIGNDGGVYLGDTLISFSSGSSKYSFDTGFMIYFNYPGYALTETFDYLALELKNSFGAWVSLSGVSEEIPFSYSYNIIPYVVVDGKKYYQNITWTGITIDKPFNHLYGYVGFEFEIIFNFDGQEISSYDNLATYFGSAVMHLAYNNLDLAVYGVNYVSTGENAIIDAINTFTEFDTEKADSITEDINTVLAQKESAESTALDGATENLNSFTVPSDGFTGFGEEFVSAVGLCSSMLQSIFASSGNFNIVISVAFILVISSMSIGMFRFFKG